MFKVATPCLDDHYFKDDTMSQLENCLHRVPKLFSNVCIWFELEQNGHKLATNAWRDRSLAFITHVSTDNVVMWRNTAQKCRLGFFQDSDFPGDLEDSKSRSGEVLCIFGHTFVPISLMCKNQTSVSHSSTETEIFSLDAGLRMDGIPALDLWDLVIETFHSVTNKIEQPKEKFRGDPLQATRPNMHNPFQVYQHTLITFKRTQYNAF